MANGATFTGPVAARLADHYTARGSPYRVYYDHGTQAQRIYCWFGDAYAAPYAMQHLAWVDIVIADPQSARVSHIIEIEDTSARPKTLLADIMAVLLSDGLAFQQRHDWQVGMWTTLTVLAYRKRVSPAFEHRLAHIQTQADHLRPYLTTGNAALGRIVLDTFRDAGDLFAKLMSDDSQQSIK